MQSSTVIEDILTKESYSQKTNDEKATAIIAYLNDCLLPYNCKVNSDFKITDEKIMLKFDHEILKRDRYNKLEYHFTSSFNELICDLNTDVMIACIKILIMPIYGIRLSANYIQNALLISYGQTYISDYFGYTPQGKIYLKNGADSLRHFIQTLMDDHFYHHGPAIQTTELLSNFFGSDLKVMNPPQYGGSLNISHIKETISNLNLSMQPQPKFFYSGITKIVYSEYQVCSSKSIFAQRNSNYKYSQAIILSPKDSTFIENFESKDHTGLFVVDEDKKFKNPEQKFSTLAHKQVFVDIFLSATTLVKDLVLIIFDFLAESLILNAICDKICISKIIPFYDFRNKLEKYAEQKKLTDKNFDITPRGKYIKELCGLIDPRLIHDNKEDAIASLDLILNNIKQNKQKFYSKFAAISFTVGTHRIGGTNNRLFHILESIEQDIKLWITSENNKDFVEVLDNPIFCRMKAGV